MSLDDIPPAVIPALIGGVVGIFGKMVVTFIRGLANKSILERKYSVDERKLITDQFSALLHDSESYRAEMRRDIDKLREENNKHHQECSDRIELLRKDAEEKMNSFEKTILDLTTDIESYRKQVVILIQFIEDNGLKSPILHRSE